MFYRLLEGSVQKKVSSKVNIFWSLDRVLCRLGCLETYHIVKDDLEFMILPPDWRDCRHVSPLVSHGVLGNKLHTSMHAGQTLSWAASPVTHLCLLWKAVAEGETLTSTDLFWEMEELMIQCLLSGYSLRRVRQNRLGKQPNILNWIETGRQKGEQTITTKEIQLHHFGHPKLVKFKSAEESRVD